MAEPLGVVASGIAIGQAVSALGLAVYKIKRLCDEIGSIPEKIDHLLDELEILNPVIEDTGAALALSDGDLGGLCNDPKARGAVVSCQRASLELELLATEIRRRLSVQSRMRRKLAGLKAVLKKEEIAAFEKRLESAVRVLTLTQNLHLMHLVRSHHELVMEKLEVSSMVSYRSVPVPAVVEGSIPQPADTSDGAERMANAEDSEDESCSHSGSQTAWPRPPKFGQFVVRQAPGGFNARIVTPIAGLAVQRAWELLVSRSYLGWKIVLQPFIHSPDDKLLKKLARAGAINDLQYLFRSRQAVIRTDEEFHNDLLLAGIDGEVSTVRMLLSMGFKWPRRVSGFPAAYRILMSMANDFGDGIDSPWLSLVLSDDIGASWNLQHTHTVFNPWIFWYFLVDIMHGSKFLRCAADLRALRDRIFPHYDRVPARDRLRQTKLLDYRELDEYEQAQFFRLSMSSTGELRPDMMVLDIKRTRSLLPRETFQWAKMLVQLGSVPENWAKILRDTVTLRTLTTLDNKDAIWGHTPLLGLVKGTAWGWLCLTPDKRTGSLVARITQMLGQWLEFLQSMGIALEVYGEWELGVLRRTPDTWDHAWCTNPYDTIKSITKCDATRHISKTPPIRLRELFIGPQLTDWRFIWETCEEEWVGLFWSLIEAPMQEQEEDAKPKLPGSWVE